MNISQGPIFAGGLSLGVYFKGLALYRCQRGTELFGVATKTEAKIKNLRSHFINIALLIIDCISFYITCGLEFQHFSFCECCNVI